MTLSAAIGGLPADEAPRSQPRMTAQQEAVLDALRHATLGEYEVFTEVGRGGMATVFLAHDIALDRKVAIKVMSPALFSGEGMVERFKREARTAAALSHPNIIPIYAVKESEDLLYFVMKFVEGRPLDSIIKEVGPLPIPMAQAILSQVAGALGCAHRHGVIHRDVKPANIMLDSEGWAVVTDFGIAKVTEVHGLTMTGATVGTPSYMSPEQCGAKELTPASDQYSLGIVGYEILTGKLPFAAETMMAIMWSHFNEPPPAVTQARPDCPPQLAAAIARMLEKEPEKRWPSLEDCGAAMGGGVLARDDAIRTRMITLASTGVNAALGKRFVTPTSPAPATTTRLSIATLTISPAEVTVAVGGAVQLTAKPRAAGGKTLPGREIRWACTDRTVAQVSANGLVTALAPGTAIVTATCGAASATASIAVMATTAPRRGRLVGLAGAALGVVIAIALWQLAPWSRGEEAREAGGPPSLAAPDSPGARASGTEPAAPPVPDSEPRATSQAAQRPRTDAQRLPPPADASTTAALRDDSIIRSVRTSAQAARERALSAGSAPADLAAGDLEFNAAESLVGRGRITEAAARFSAALASWTMAERAARAPGAPGAPIVAVDTSRRRAESTPPSPAAPAPSPQPANDRLLIERAIADYARAIESGELSELRRTYPGMTAAQERAWQDFFGSVRNLRVGLSVAQLAINGERAEATVSGLYEYDNVRTGQAARTPVTFRAVLRREAAGWRLSAVR